MSYDLRDKVVLITGASSGIGRACAVEFHRSGARVAAAARSADKLQGLAGELGDDRILPVHMDVTEGTQRDAALAAIRARWGRVDVLVNNAGWASFGSVMDVSLDDAERMVRLNLLSAVAMIKAVLPEMIARRSGQIINISSVVGNQPIARMAFYSATKAALSSLTAGLRMELRGTGVDVILVSPGSTATGFFEAATLTNVAAVRLAETQYTPQRVARAVVGCSRRRRREVTLSVEGKAITIIRRVSHTLADAIMVRVAKRSMPATKR
jgi:short-subunit dehydrogenase